MNKYSKTFYTYQYQQTNIYSISAIHSIPIHKILFKIFGCQVKGSFFVLKKIKRTITGNINSNNNHMCTHWNICYCLHLLRNKKEGIFTESAKMMPFENIDFISNNVRKSLDYSGRRKIKS